MKNFILFCSSVIFVVVVLELGLRILPVASSTYIQSVNEKEPYMHFKKNYEFIWSKNWDFSIVSHKKTNNYGYMSSIDFEPNSDNTIAVIGDSYVEAMQVDNKETFHHILNNTTNKTFYPIGTSGSPLSQYIAYAKFASEDLGIEQVIFTIISNDFDESLFKYKQAAGHHYFDTKNGKDYYLKRVDYNPSAIKILLRESYLIRYLLINAGIKNIKNIFDNKEYSANTLKYTSTEYINDSKKAVNIFFQQLRKLNFKSENIVFLIDGNREEIYDGKKDTKSYFSKMRKYFISEARSKGYKVIDLHQAFKDDYEKYEKRFEYEKDWHWNEYGHKIVSQAIKDGLWK